MYPKPVMDLHTHTIASGHAYSTLRENFEAAKVAGLQVIGTSEHARLMPGTAPQMYFINFKVIPKEMDGIRIVNGIEANIYDEKGSIDVEEPILGKMDYIIASLHIPCVKDMGFEGNTNAYLGAIKNPDVSVIGHPDDGRYPFDIDAVAAAAAEYHTALELNNSSLKPGATRVGGRENSRKMLEACKKYGTMVLMGSDSHICYDIGKFDEALKLLEEVNFPEEQVLNFDRKGLEFVLRAGRKGL